MEKFWNFKKNISEEESLYYSNCKENISSVEKNSIINDLDSSLSDYNLREYFDKQPYIFSEYSHLVVFKNKEKSVGLLGVKWLKDNTDANVLYFWTAIIVNEFQNSNMLFRMIQCLMNQVVAEDKFPDYISTKTYNPKVFKVFYGISNLMGAGTFYPEIDKQQNEELKSIAVKVSEELMAKPNLIVEKGILIGGQVIEFPLNLSNNELVNQYFKDNLTPKDQFLIVLKIPSNRRNNLVSSYF
jgi:hypothetical protein